MGLVGMGGWFLVVYDWVYPHCKRGCVDSTIFERFSNNLIEFSPNFVVFGRYSLFWTTPGKDSGKFPEVPSFGDDSQRNIRGSFCLNV